MKTVHAVLQLKVTYLQVSYLWESIRIQNAVLCWCTQQPGWTFPTSSCLLPKYNVLRVWAVEPLRWFLLAKNNETNKSEPTQKWRQQALLMSLHPANTNGGPYSPRILWLWPLAEHKHWTKTKINKTDPLASKFTCADSLSSQEDEQFLK